MLTMKKNISESKYNNALYTLLNKLISANYGILSVLNEECPFDDDSKSPTKQYFEDDGNLFGKNGSIFEDWQNIKMNAFLDLRNRIIQKMNDYFSKYSLEDDIKKTRNSLIKNFNSIYDENKKFDEVFCKNDIINQRFYSDIINDLNGIETSVNKEKFVELCDQTNSYFELYDFYMNYIVFKDIYSVLVDDLKPNGYRSFYFERPRNEKVKKFNIEQLFELNKKIEDFGIKKAKLRKPLIQNLYKAKNNKSNNSDLYMKLLQKYNDYEDDMTKLTELFDLTEAILKRCLATNSYDLNNYDKLCDLTHHLISGNMKTHKNKLQLPNFYIHVNELKDIIKLMNVHEELKPLAKQLENLYFASKQPENQKI